jgi:hypothetical protein
MCLVCFVSAALGDDFKTINGKEYKNATVSQIEPDGLVLKSKSGISKVYFAELPNEVQQRFHYDPAQGTEFTTSTQTAISQSNVAIVAQQQAVAAEQRRKAEIQRQQQAEEQQRQAAEQRQIAEQQRVEALQARVREQQAAAERQREAEDKARAQQAAENQFLRNRVINLQKQIRAQPIDQRPEIDRPHF